MELALVGLAIERNHRAATKPTTIHACAVVKRGVAGRCAEGAFELRQPAAVARLAVVPAAEGKNPPFLQVSV